MDKTKNNIYKIALLGDSSTQLLAQALTKNLKKSGINFNLFESDYNQIHLQILSSDSELYAFSPDIVIVFQSTRKLLHKFYSGNDTQMKFSENELEITANLVSHLEKYSKAGIIWSNYPELNDGVYGNYANKTNGSFLYHLRKINLGLMHLAQKHPSFFINDLSLLQNESGKEVFFDTRMYVNADMVYGTEILPRISENICQIISSITGKFKKCLILDLDNTMWGGVIGDDGIDKIQIGELGIGKAFTEIQMWAKALKNRGIILAICSKNEESTAKEPFEKHPAMVLKPDDIAVFKANWDNKADNIRSIQNILNIGFDSMVFLDDNPFERDMVRKNIPGITVPELPEDPADYVTFLQKCNLFETALVTDDDLNRTRQYQTEAKRTEHRKTFVNEDEFMKSLRMSSQVKPFDSFTIPRVAQLTQRSNQFNLRTVRYNEDQIKNFSESTDYATFSYNLTDIYGDNGLISVIILKKQNDALFIDTWIMSCRVLKRSMENFVLNTLVEYALNNNFRKIIGEYIPTPKNCMVKNHYSDLGFEQISDKWVLNVMNYKIRKCFINIT